MRINLWALLIILAAVYFLFVIREDILTYNELAGEKDSIGSRIKAISDENNKLSQALSNIDIERLARERLNLVKKGEIAFKVCR